MSNFKIILFLSMALSLSLRAQSQDSLSVETQQESVAAEDTVVMPFLSSVSISVDYGKFFGQFLPTESKYEFGSQVDFKNRWILIGEFGFAILNPNNVYQNADYESSGQYFRVGLGYKIDMTAKHNLYFSARYARSTYSDQGIVNIDASSLYNDLVSPFERSGLSAQWYELAMSSEARIWKGLYAGFHIRFRIMDKYDKQEPLDVYSIPGYGRTIDKTIPAFNLYLKYAFERF